jgi:hypothetical protein
VAALVAAGGAVGAASPAGATAVAATLTISSPAAGELITPSTVIQGSAESPAGIAVVGVMAGRPSGTEWLQPDGSLGPAPSAWPAALSSPGSPSTAWSITLPVVAGDLILSVQALANDGSIAVASVAVRVAAAPVLTPPMLTLQFGRAMLGQGAGCQPLAGQPTIFDVASELQRRGMFAVGVVVPDRTGETAALCVNGNLHSSWADLARLRDEFRWSFVSNGQSRLDLPGLSRTAQIAESCGSLDALAAHGHDRAWGMFGPNSNQITDAIATDVLNHCFAFTRMYSNGRTDQRRLAAPYYESVRVAGGGTGGYDTPAEILERVGVIGDGVWLTLGSYKLVLGAQSGTGRLQWDCTSPDPIAHWTTDDEVYCWQDYFAIIDALRTQSLEVVDPATVAVRWGRVPTVDIERFTVPATASAASAAVEGSFSAYESGTFSVVVGTRCDSPVVIATGAYRAGSDQAVTIPVASLPVGRSDVQLCLRNAFGRVGSAAVAIDVTT